MHLVFYLSFRGEQLIRDPSVLQSLMVDTMKFGSFQRQGRDDFNFLPSNMLTL